MRIGHRTFMMAVQSACSTAADQQLLLRALGTVNPWLTATGTHRICSAQRSTHSLNANVSDILAAAAAAAAMGHGRSSSSSSSSSGNLHRCLDIHSRHSWTTTTTTQQCRHSSMSAAMVAEPAVTAGDEGAAAGTPAAITGPSVAAGTMDMPDTHRHHQHDRKDIGQRRNMTMKGAASQVGTPSSSSSSRVAASESGSCRAGASSHTDNRGGDGSSSSSSNSSSNSSSSSTATESSGSGSSNTNSSASVATTATGAAGQVAVDIHPLPGHVIDDEEQQSLDKAIAVINRLCQAGFMGLIVGGWVRDRFLGRRASDIDIATNATPKQLRRLFPRLVELPRSTVKLTHQGEVLEVTCFRGISRAAGMFSVAMDAARRDFTVNALYYDPLRGEVLDCVGGVSDAASRTLRLTADPGARLREDPLRALRAVRFATQLGLRLAPDTARTLQEHAHLCSVQQGLPARRIWLELRKLYRAEQQQPGSWQRALNLCYHLGLLPALLPWLQGDAAAAQQAVLVAGRLSKMWTAQQQSVPLSLMVAATVPPSQMDKDITAQQVQQYFSSDPAELEAIQTLMHAAQLVNSSSKVSDSSGTSSSADSSSNSSDEPWVQLYANDLSQTCLQVLAAWMPDVLSDTFRQHHRARMLQLADRISKHRQQLFARQAHRESQGALNGAFAAGEASVAVGIQARRLRQQEELQAAIQALLGEQDQMESAEGVEQSD